MLDLHAQILSVSVSFNLTYVVVQLAKSSSVPILKHHNNPAKDITLDMLPGQKEERDNLGKNFTILLLRFTADIAKYAPTGALRLHRLLFSYLPYIYVQCTLVIHLVIAAQFLNR